MKKLFVSLPMKGREKEKILDSMEMMKQIAEIIFHESPVFGISESLWNSWRKLIVLSGS